MNQPPLISIIILNYNQLEVTCEFLNSAKSLTYPNYEIILVDNASSDDPTLHINKYYPEVHLIVNDKNYGFTGGNNIGMKAAKGEYFFIVNNDTEVNSNLLEMLLEPFYMDESIGMVSPKIKFYHQPDLIQYAGFTKINPFTGRNKAIGSKERDTGQYDQGGYTNYAHGAAMLVKREVTEKVGMFPDHFFIYYEELDWSAHTKRAGFEIYYQPKAEILHKESVTMGKESAIKAYYHNRNRILFMRRNSNPFEFLCFLFFLILLIIPKSIIQYIIKGQKEHLTNFIKGLIWNLKTPKYLPNQLNSN
ncbi:MAG: glycosyltransferase family 2 protein [Cyclobacteriaceae bacterium]